MDLAGLAMDLISKNPRIANNPVAQNYLQIIRNGDSAKGQQIAMNLCQTYGISKEKAVQEARRFFNI